jgi:hypothetical protein
LIYLLISGGFLFSSAIFSQPALKFKNLFARVDLALERCQFIGKSDFQGGEIGKVYFIVKNNGNMAQEEFQITAWNVFGKTKKKSNLESIPPEERGNILIKKPYRRHLQPEATYSGTLEVSFQESKSGAYTLYIEVTPIDPENDGKPKDNQETLSYKYKAVFQIK